MQLSKHTEQFAALGVNIITITYDTNKQAQTFVSRSNINFPIAHDEDSALIKQLGILNTGPQPGDGAYGIPYPGIFLVDKTGIIRAKFAEESFRTRPEIAPILEAATNL